MDTPSERARAQAKQKKEQDELLRWIDEAGEKQAVAQRRQPAQKTRATAAIRKGPPRLGPGVPRRARIIRLGRAGRSADEIAELLGISPNEVRLWTRRLRDDGLVGLIDQPRPGRPPKATKRQAQRLLGDPPATAEQSCRAAAALLTDPSGHQLVSASSVSRYRRKLLRTPTGNDNQWRIVGFYLSSPIRMVAVTNSTRGILTVKDDALPTYDLLAAFVMLAGMIPSRSVTPPKRPAGSAMLDRFLRNLANTWGKERRLFVLLDHSNDTRHRIAATHSRFNGFDLFFNAKASDWQRQLIDLFFDADAVLLGWIDRGALHRLTYRLFRWLRTGTLTTPLTWTKSRTRADGATSPLPKSSTQLRNQESHPFNDSYD